MSEAATALEALRRENEDLRQRLGEAESIVRAISKHEVDAFVVEKQGEDLVLVLDGVDRPYRLLIERMQQGAAILAPDGTLIYVNRRLAELVAVDPSSLINTPFSNYVSASERPAFAELLARGQSTDAECALALHGGGATPFPALLTLSPMRDTSGVLCLIVTDLRLQKQHEQERAARAAAEQVAEVLRAADRRKDEFLAMLAHELRNPLAPLRNGLQILNLVGSPELVAQQTREMMARQLESFIRLVDDLLDVSRVTQGKIKLKVERADLKRVLMRAVESCRSLLDEKGHRLEMNLPDAPVPVEADVVRLTQVVTNLLNNAAKFTPPGGHVALTLAADPVRREAVVRVRDDGKGISAEMLASIFDLFAQVDPSTSRNEGGLGIGLTLSRRLVEMHGGSLEAASAGIGRGSEFIVRLPLAAELQAAPQASAGSAQDRQAGRRILIVDDNRDSADSLMKLLRLLGHDVRDAFDGQQALAILKDFVPDLLLLDIGLPGMNGYELAGRIRSDERLRNVRIVALSGYGGDDDRRRSHDAGFHAHLVKPVDFGFLQTLLATDA